MPYPEAIRQQFIASRDLLNKSGVLELARETHPEFITHSPQPGPIRGGAGKIDTCYRVILETPRRGSLEADTRDISSGTVEVVRWRWFGIGGDSVRNILFIEGKNVQILTPMEYSSSDRLRQALLAVIPLKEECRTEPIGAWDD